MSVKSDTTIGGNGRSNSHDDKVDSIIPSVVGIKTITIGLGSLVDSFQCIYVLLGGGIYEGNWIGGSGGGISIITFENDEILHHLMGRTRNTYADKLVLSTRRGNTSERHGPYGWTWSGRATTSEFSGIIMGFHGHSSHYEQSLARSGIEVYTLT